LYLKFIPLAFLKLRKQDFEGAKNGYPSSKPEALEKQKQLYLLTYHVSKHIIKQRIF
jgi:hypothetical protein